MSTDGKTRHFVYGPNNGARVYVDGNEIAIHVYGKEVTLTHADADHARRVLQKCGYRVTWEYLPDGMLVDSWLQSARFNSPCAMNSEHRIKVGDWRPGVVAVTGIPGKEPYEVLGTCCPTCLKAVEDWWDNAHSE